MKEEKKNIAIVWANPYNMNLGVAALGYSSLALLNDVVKENNIDAQFTFLGSSKNKPDQVKIGKDIIKFDNIFAINFYNWKTSVKKWFFNKHFRISDVEKFDYVFDISEGDSFTDIYGKDRFNIILNTKRYFSSIGVKQIMLPQTIGPFKSSVHEDLAFEGMSKLDNVISRDKQSFDYSAKFLSKEKILETIDVAFYMPFEKIEFSKGKIHVGINVSGLLWNGGYTKDNQFEMKTDYQSLIRKTIDFFINEENVVVHIVPHVIPADHPVEDDYLVSEDLQKKYKELIVAPRFSSPIEAKSYISGLDFFTGARMHACIAAFSAGVPVFPMAYSRKFNGLFKETLRYEWMGDCVKEDSDTVFNGLVASFNNRCSIKQVVEERNVEIVRPRLKRLKNLLAKVLLR